MRSVSPAIEDLSQGHPGLPMTKTKALQAPLLSTTTPKPTLGSVTSSAPTENSQTPSQQPLQRNYIRSNWERRFYRVDCHRAIQKSIARPVTESNGQSSIKSKQIIKPLVPHKHRLVPIMSKHRTNRWESQIIPSEKLPVAPQVKILILCSLSGDVPK
jgi:hypothetical protein